MLRAVGITAPIVLLEGVINAEQLAAAAELSLELVVHDALQVALLEGFRWRDDGVGGTLQTGHGLNGLKERVAQIGGTLAIDAPRGGGLALTVEVPA